jgi:hypothetical protein
LLPRLCVEYLEASPSVGNAATLLIVVSFLLKYEYSEGEKTCAGMRVVSLELFAVDSLSVQKVEHRVISKTMCLHH